ncbi:MAG: arylsulfatase [Bacteroidota bacterium]
MSGEKQPYNFLVSLTLLLSMILMGCSNKEQPSKKPNILFIMVDDMGYSDLGCYGGEINTPNIDELANNGIRFTQFYNTAKCMSSRACFLTGLYAQQTEMDKRPLELKNAVTLGEVLQTVGYRTYLSGKHHGTENLYYRGFDHYFGWRDGGGNYWNPGVKREGEPAPANKGIIRYWCDDSLTYHPYTPEDKNFYTTDVFTNMALEWLNEEELDESPFFLYLAYQAPHYPLHAWPEDIQKYKGHYDDGYLAIRAKRYQKMVDIGLIDPLKSPLPEMAPEKWDTLSGLELEKEKLRMEIYAAMVDRVDQSIGKIIAKLKQQKKYENTLIMFASDNGACAEDPRVSNRSTNIEDFGKISSYEVVGENWATVQNTPLRYWKNYSHEGGIRTPFIVSWPNYIKEKGSINNQTGHFIDIMSTLVELSGAEYPVTFNGNPIIPMQGVSLMPTFKGDPIHRDKPIYWQWSRGGGIREGNIKAVFWNDQWELYDLTNNPNETNNLSNVEPEKLQDLINKWERWYDDFQ